MPLCRVFCLRDLCRDLFVGVPGGNQPEHVDFARAELVFPGAFRHFGRDLRGCILSLLPCSRIPGIPALARNSSILPPPLVSLEPSKTLQLAIAAR